MKYNKKEIREFNIKIAEFMNAKVVNTYVYFNEVSYLLYYEKNTSPEMCKHIACSALKYHSSWEWLMTVVDKIEMMKFPTKRPNLIANADYTLQWEYRSTGWKAYWFSMLSPDDILTHLRDGKSEEDFVYCSTKIEAVYNAVIEFIVWQTNQIKNIETKF